MKKIIGITVMVLATLTLASCGGGSGGGDGGEDGESSLTYSGTVTAYTTEGLTTYTKGKALGDSYSEFVALDLTDSSIAESATIYSKATAFMSALESYNTHISSIGSYAATAFPSAASSSISIDLKGVKTLGVSVGSDLNDMSSVLQAKKAECEALYAQIDTVEELTSPGAEEIQGQYRQCVAELGVMAGEEGLKIAVVEAGGSVVGGAAAGGAFIYIVGGGAAALLTGPGVLVVLVGGLVGSEVASAIYSYCRSGSSDSLNAKTIGSNEYCAAASVSGTTGQSMAMNTTGGTGTLHVFVEGYAPAMLESISVTAGQTTTVTVYPIALEDVDDDSSETLESANDSSSSSESEATGSSCSDVVTIGAENSPADPGPGDTVTVTATVIPVVSGCTVSYSVYGTDTYSAYGSPTSDSSGQITFVIPGGAEGVNDVVTITESSSGVSASLAYTF